MGCHDGGGAAAAPVGGRGACDWPGVFAPPRQKEICDHRTRQASVCGLFFGDDGHQRAVCRHALGGAARAVAAGASAGGGLERTFGLADRKGDQRMLLPRRPAKAACQPQADSHRHHGQLRQNVGQAYSGRDLEREISHAHHARQLQYPHGRHPRHPGEAVPLASGVCGGDGGAARGRHQGDVPSGASDHRHHHLGGTAAPGNVQDHRACGLHQIRADRGPARRGFPRLLL